MKMIEDFLAIFPTTSSSVCLAFLCLFNTNPGFKDGHKIDLD